MSEQALTSNTKTEQATVSWIKHELAFHHAQLAAPRDSGKNPLALKPSPRGLIPPQDALQRICLSLTSGKSTMVTTGPASRIAGARSMVFRPKTVARHIRGTKPNETNSNGADSR
jgi:hypothetical protein